ncbi:MAG: metal ABC transporter permease [Elusimicrobia bacterium]|nr:metal ABC transporter permease [Elusimicrobiota bacterium]
MLMFQYHFATIALLVCLILTGIHTYMGYHVVRRGVIFVDLSLAQVAALGSSVAILLGWGEQFPVRNYLMSLSFTLIGALLFVVFRSKREKVPIEALIGITYAGSIALSLIVLEHAATGTEEIKEMLTGSLLTVSPKEVAFIAVLYSAIGIIHWLARKQLLLVTEAPDKARDKGMKLWWWDFVFYATFGMIVTSSVKVAGVLLVFAFLIIPAVAAMTTVEGTSRRIMFGWLFGIIGCFSGLELSLRLDWSTGPTIVTAFLVLLIGVWLTRTAVTAFTKPGRA